MLGTVARDEVVRLLELLATGDSRALLAAADELESFAPDYTQVLDELAALLVRIGLRQAVADYAGDERYAAELLARLAAALSAEDVQLYYQIAIAGRRDLPLAPDPRSGFQMTLLRMLAFRPGSDAGLAQPAPQAGARTTGPAPAAAAPASEEAGGWPQLIARLELSGAARQLAQHCVLLGRSGAIVRLGLDPAHQLVRTAATEERLAQALAKHFGAVVRLEFQPAGGADTPAQAQRRASEQELAGARRAFESDPGVRGLRERFGATVLPETVRPVK